MNPAGVDRPGQAEDAQTRPPRRAWPPPQKRLCAIERHPICQGLRLWSRPRTDPSSPATLREEDMTERHSRLDHPWVRPRRAHRRRLCRAREPEADADYRAGPWRATDDHDRGRQLARRSRRRAGPRVDGRSGNTANGSIPNMSTTISTARIWTKSRSGWWATMAPTCDALIIAATGASAKYLGLPSEQARWARACRPARPATAFSTRGRRWPWWAAATPRWKRRYICPISPAMSRWFTAATGCAAKRSAGQAV